MLNARGCLLLATLISSMMIAPRPALASEWKLRPGERVMVITAEAVARADDGRSETHQMGTVLKVRQVHGRNIVVQSRTFDGTVAIADVMVLHEAQEYLDRELTKTPASAALHFARGMYWSFADLPRAVEDLSNSIRLNPEFAAAYTARGRCYARMGEVEKAKTDFAHSLKLDPKNPATYVARAEMWWSDGLGKSLPVQLEAMRDLQRAAELDPQYGETYEHRARYKIEAEIYYYKLDKDLDQSPASDDVEKSLRIHPNSAAVLVSQARLLSRTRFVADLVKANQIYVRATQVDMFFRAAFANRALNCITLSKLSQSAIDSFLTLRADWRHAKSLRRLAHCLKNNAARLEFMNYLNDVPNSARRFGELLLQLDLEQVAAGIEVLEGKPDPEDRRIGEPQSFSSPLDVTVKKQSQAWYVQFHGYGRPRTGHVLNAAGNSAVIQMYFTNLPALLYLLANGADPDVKSAAGETCLHYVCRSGNLVALHALLSCDADKQIRTPKNELPLELAIRSSHPWMPLLLVMRGADLGALSSQGLPLLDLAREQFHLPKSATAADVRRYCEAATEETLIRIAIELLNSAAKNRNESIRVMMMHEKFPDGLIVGGLSRREVSESIERMVDEDFNRRARIADAATQAANVSDEQVIQLVRYAYLLLPEPRARKVLEAILTARATSSKTR